MRWLLATWGSRGDLHPFLALGRGLIERGHQVTLVGNPDWRDETIAAGLEFVSSDETSLEKKILEHPEFLSLRWRGLTSIHALVKYGILPGLDGFYAALKKAAPNHDVLVAHHFVFAAPLVAEKTGMPWVSVALAPGVTPSSYHVPGTNFTPLRKGWHHRFINRMNWAVGRRLIRPLIDPMVNSWRIGQGGRPGRDHFYKYSPQLYLQLFSESFHPRPRDWSEEKQYGGFCFYDPPATQLSSEMENFLSQGDAPVLCTLGSTAVHSPGSFYLSASLALQELGLRGLFLIGEERNRPSRLPESILAMTYAPYGLLMPRVKLVIHQGGIGTLAQTLKAGKASLVCPYAFDQPSNARFLEALDVGVALPPNHRSKQDMVEGLKKLLAGSAQKKAELWKEKLRNEDGVGRTCAILENHFRHLSLNSHAS